MPIMPSMPGSGTAVPPEVLPPEVDPPVVEPPEVVVLPPDELVLPHIPLPELSPQPQ